MPSAVLRILPPNRGGGRPGAFAAELEVFGIQRPLAADESAVRAPKDASHHPIGEDRRGLPDARCQVGVSACELRAEAGFALTMLHTASQLGTLTPSVLAADPTLSRVTQGTPGRNG
jgi:hypothetical protein